MKKILITMPSLTMGGVEKSLISFLSALEKYKENYEIDLLCLRRGQFYEQDLPSYVNIIEISPEMYALYNSFGTNNFFSHTSLRAVIIKVLWLLRYRENNNTYGRKMQIMWNFWSKYIPIIKKEYDVAISYTNGLTNYIVIDKTIAKKKILWIHSEYQKLGCKYNYDRHYFEKADSIVTISEKCKKNLYEVFPEIKDKIVVLENITSRELVLKLANKPDEDINFNEHGATLLTVGRLSKEKGIDIAIRAASILKENKLIFKWFIVGEGIDRAYFEELIKEYNVQDCFILLGAKRNPYFYMNKCDIYIQPSRYEGKSIVLDEVKILSKPIIVTNYTTVADTIEDDITGKICNINENDLASKIMELLDDKGKQNQLIQNLKHNNYGNEAEIFKYMDLLEE